MYEQVIKEVASALKAINDVVALLLVGSYVRDRASVAEAIGDLDFLVITVDKAEPYFHEVGLRLHQSGVISLMRCDDALRGLHPNGVVVSVAIRSAESINTEVTAFALGKRFSGDRCRWAVGCYLPEGFAADICTAQVLFDANDLVARIRQQFNPYPSAARTAILRYCAEEILGKVVLLRQGDVDWITRSILVADLAIALTRTGWALERKYLPALKKIGRFSAEITGEGKDFLEAAQTLACRVSEARDISATLERIAVLQERLKAQLVGTERRKEHALV